MKSTDLKAVPSPSRAASGRSFHSGAGPACDAVRGCEARGDRAVCDVAVVAARCRAPSQRALVAERPLFSLGSASPEDSSTKGRSVEGLAVEGEVGGEHPDEDCWVEGMRAARYRVALSDVPVDFFADPDGDWQLESLTRAAGFEGQEGVAVGALTQSFRGHPEGSAVVTLNAKARPYVAVVECAAHVTMKAGTAA